MILSCMPLCCSCQEVPYAERSAVFLPCAGARAPVRHGGQGRRQAFRLRAAGDDATHGTHGRATAPAIAVPSGSINCWWRNRSVGSFEAGHQIFEPIAVVFVDRHQISVRSQHPLPQLARR